jgi:hypothetical protein
MKLFILRNRNARAGDLASAMIRSPDEEVARTQASLIAGAEGEACWLNPVTSSCTVISVEGRPKVLLEDFIYE